MTIAVGVDFGTSSTCVTVAVGAEHARVVVIDGSPLMPSAVYADGHTVFVGAEAQRQAALDPSRYEPTPTKDRCCSVTRSYRYSARSRLCSAVRYGRHETRWAARLLMC